MQSGNPGRYIYDNAPDYAEGNVMYWAVIFKISATVLLLTAGLLTIPHALLGATLRNILLGTVGVSGVVAAVSVFKLKDIDKAHSVSETNRSNSHTEHAAASKGNPGANDDD